MHVEIKKLSLISDERGWLTEILKKDELFQGIVQIHFSFSKRGAVRGNHYHKHRIEWLCVTSGTGRILLEDNGTHERKELIVSGDSPVLVKIYPNITHAIENCASLPMHLLIVTFEKYGSKETDIYSRQIVLKSCES